MSLMAVFKGRYGATGFGFASTAEEVCASVDLSGKTVLVTGVNSGIGLETARVIGARGAHVVGLARTREKATAALASAGANGTPIECDLAAPETVRAAAARVRDVGKPLDAVIANAGIMGLPTLTQAHGYELQFFTNHIGHFLLVTSVLDALAPDARVVVVSSGAHMFAPHGGIEFDNLSGARGYSPFRAYGQAKLANVLFARALARRFAGTRRTANAVHPGGIHTNLARHMQSRLMAGLTAAFGWIGMKSIAQGAATQCFVAVHPRASGITGRYWVDCNVARPSRLAESESLAEELWQTSERIGAALGPPRAIRDRR